MPGAHQATVLVDLSPCQVRTEVAAATGDRKVLAVSVADGVPADADDPAWRQIIDRADPLRRGHRNNSLLWGNTTATVSISGA